MIRIPCIDLRKSSPVALLEARRDQALEILEGTQGVFGMASKVFSRLLLPMSDHLVRRWLHSCKNPYLSEIQAYEKILRTPGVVTFNLCYEWGCTTSVYQSEKGPLLIRVLDWPFPKLGENLVVTRQSGPGGDFYNMTWPGVSGVFQALAPGRFSAALNQAPMRRHRTGIFLDWARNRLHLSRHKGLPPAHLLRHVLESAPDYETAKELLATARVSIPVIYVLAGVKNGEGCVIERLEDRVVIRELASQEKICATNHFESHLNGIGHGWMPRSADSDKRALMAQALTCHEIDRDFSWFKAPIANPLSRLALRALASEGTFSLIGTNGVTPVTEVFHL